MAGENREIRHSGIELLRIICMFFIITSHYSVLGNKLGDITNAGNAFTMPVIFMQLMSMFSRLSCCIFIIITGYFLSAKESSTYGADLKGHYKKMIPLILEMLFYSMCIYLISAVTGGGRLLSISGVKALFPVLWGNWFIKAYLIFYTIIPFINRGLHQFDKRALGKLIALLLVLWSVIPTLSGHAWDHFGDIDMMIIMYCVGAYIRRYEPEKNSHRRYIFLGLTVFLHLSSVLVLDFLAARFSINYFAKHATYLREYTSVTSVAIAVLLFVIFKDLNVKSRLVNEAAKGVFAVYLIHLDPLAQNFIWHTIWDNSKYLTCPYYHLIAKSLIILIAGLSLDYIRRCSVARIIDKRIEECVLKLIEKKERIKNRAS